MGETGHEGYDWTQRCSQGSHTAPTRPNSHNTQYVVKTWSLIKGIKCAPWRNGHV